MGRYHELLQYGEPGQLRAKPLVGVQILHYGNSDDRLLEKNLSRDIPLLELMRQEGPLDLWRLDCLARKYLKSGQAEKAEACYQEALERLWPHLIEGQPPEDFFWVPTLLDTLGAQAVAAADYETARLICQRGLEWCPHYPPLNYLAGEVLMELGFPLGALAYFEHCLQLGRQQNYYRGAPCPASFIKTFPAYGLGCAYMQLQRWQEARAAFELALSFDTNYEEARLKLQELPESPSETQDEPTD